MLSSVIHVSYDAQPDMEHFHGPIWGQVALILTGLTDEQLRRLGGVRFVDVHDGQERARCAEPIE
jgi:hypothetical protein